MRWIVAVVLAGCTAPPVHYVTCAGLRVDVPATMRVVRRTGSELIAASPDVALAVFEDGPSRRGGRARVIEQISDLDRPMYRVAFRDRDRCTFRAVALLPESPEGRAVLAAVAGSDEPTLFVGSPRVLERPAVGVLLDMLPH